MGADRASVRPPSSPVFGGYAVAGAVGAFHTRLRSGLSLCVRWSCLRWCAGVLRYAEQACNHFIAFKLLALIRDRVFRALRRLCPAKLEGQGQGEPDFRHHLGHRATGGVLRPYHFPYRHCRCCFPLLLCLFIGGFHPLLGVIALAAYLTVGVAIPLITSTPQRRRRPARSAPSQASCPALCWTACVG